MASVLPLSHSPQSVKQSVLSEKRKALAPLLFQRVVHTLFRRGGMHMKRVWIITIAALLMITAGCGKTAETQELSPPEEISTEVSVEDEDNLPVDDSSLFQPVEGPQISLAQQSDVETVDIETENDQQKAPVSQTDRESPFQEVNEATAETETQGSIGSQEEPPPDSPSEPPTLLEESTETEEDPIQEPPEKTEEPEPEEPVETTPKETEPAFDISYWISFAQNVAQEKGLQLESSAVDCWDNPIAAGPGCTCTERDINGYLSRYAADPDITDVWIWAEPRNDGSGRYDLYIGYA